MRYMHLAVHALRRGHPFDPKRYVYFARDPDQNVKIGSTSNVKSRLVALRTEFKLPLKLAAVVPGSFVLENSVQKALRPRRMDVRGREWFRAGPEVENLIAFAQQYHDLAPMMALYIRLAASGAVGPGTFDALIHQHRAAGRSAMHAFQKAAKTRK